MSECVREEGHDRASDAKLLAFSFSRALIIINVHDVLHGLTIDFFSFLRFLLT